MLLLAVFAAVAVSAVALIEIAGRSVARFAVAQGGLIVLPFLVEGTAAALLS